MIYNDTLPGPVPAATPLPVEHITPRASLHFGEESDLRVLMADIRRGGLHKPILVRRSDSGRFQVVSGNRRLMACRRLGMPCIDATILPPMPHEDAHSLLTALSSGQYHYLDEALMLETLNTRFSMRLDDIAAALSRTVQQVTGRIRLMALDEPLRGFLMEEGIPERIAQALLRLPDDERRMSIARRAVREWLCIRDVEALVTAAITRCDAPKTERRRRCDRHQRQHVVTVMRDARPYINAIRDIAGQMQAAGVRATLTENASGGQMELVIRLSTRRRRTQRYQASSM